MKFGLAFGVPYPLENTAEENGEYYVEQAVRASQNGFDILFSGHHYLVDDGMQFQPVPGLSYAAGQCPTDVHVGTNILLPLHNPVEIAEQFATIDVLTGGRAILGPVLGYRDDEFDSFGVDKADRRGRMNESIEIIKRLWTEDSVSYDGEHFQLDDVTINPKPVQDPRPPIWIGANRDRAIKRAAEIGDAWYINPHDHLDVLEEQIDLIDPPSGDGLRGLQPMCSFGLVAETDEEAFRRYEPYIKGYFDWYEREGQHEEMATPEAIDLEETGFERFLIGSPETVADKLVDLNERLGIDCMIMSMYKTGIGREHVLESIELMGEEVIPEVNDRLE